MTNGYETEDTSPNDSRLVDELQALMEAARDLTHVSRVSQAGNFIGHHCSALIEKARLHDSRELDINSLRPAL